MTVRYGNPERIEDIIDDGGHNPLWIAVHTDDLYAGGWKCEFEQHSDLYISGYTFHTGEHSIRCMSHPNVKAPKFAKHGTIFTVPSLTDEDDDGRPLLVVISFHQDEESAKAWLDSKFEQEDQKVMDEIVKEDRRHNDAGAYEDDGDCWHDQERYDAEYIDEDAAVQRSGGSTSAIIHQHWGFEDEPPTPDPEDPTWS